MADPLPPAPVATPPAVYSLARPDLRIDTVSGLAAFLLKLGPCVDADAVARALGAPLPEPGRSLDGDRGQWLNLGPREWLLTGSPAQTRDLAGAFDEGFAGGAAALIDLSDSFLALDLAGPKAQSLLAQGVALDLIRHFPPGSATRTRLGAIVVILARDARERFRLIVSRPYAVYLTDWLTAVAQEP